VRKRKRVTTRRRRRRKRKRVTTRRRRKRKRVTTRRRHRSRKRLGMIQEEETWHDTHSMRQERNELIQIEHTASRMKALQQGSTTAYCAPRAVS